MRGSAIDTSRSRNSHIRSPRSVTFAPIGMPSRILKPAIDLRARRTWARCPAMIVSSSTAESSCFASFFASPTPMLSVIFGDARDLHDRAELELLLEARRGARSRTAP